MRCEMKMTALPRSRQRRIIAKMRSDRSAGRDAVISSSSRTAGSEASARARSISRSSG